MAESSGLKQKQRKQSGLALRLVAAAVVLLGVPKIQSAPGVPFGEVAVDDGRIIVVEAVTYGTNHVVGSKSVLVEHLGPWMPDAVRDMLSPKLPQTSIDTAPGTLVVWLNAVNPNTRAWVDCQGLRLEFVDEHGDLWGTKTSSWHSFGNKFYRIAHIFEAYPRAATNLTLRITPRRSGGTFTISVPNPHVAKAANWSGDPLPVRTVKDSFEIVLQDLEPRTGGGSEKPWETPAKYWQPEWKFLSGGKPVEGWHEPVWTASDPVGNRGQFLGVHQPVIRYSVEMIPKATNTSATEVIAVLPSSSLGLGVPNRLWLRTNLVSGVEVTAIGLMTTLMNHFMEGEYQAVPELPIGPTQGGAPTGWVVGSKRVSPLKVITQFGHYSDRPTIYLRCTDAVLAEKLGVRVQDDQGRIWPTTRETESIADGIIPFMLDVPSDVTNVVPEIVLLKPVEAQFTVRTPAAGP